MTTTPRMRAVRQHTLGDPSVLQIDHVPVPEPGPSEVLVRVEATSLSPTDWVHRAIPGFLGTGTRTLGWDVAGVVVERGLGVTVHSVGDRVFGMLPYPHGHGAAAELVVAPARALVPIPRDVPSTTAAALPLVGLTAWQSLVDTADLRAGQRVLVHAAAGGVGHVAVQLAAELGAHVIGTASAANHAVVRDLGAHEVVDYRRPDLQTQVGQVDVVLDAIGGDTTRAALGVLRRGGVVVSLPLNRVTPLGPQARAAGVRHELLLVEHDQLGMRALADRLADGRLRPLVESVAPLFDLEAVRDAHRRGESNHVVGKLVLEADGRPPTQPVV